MFSFHRLPLRTSTRTLGIVLGIAVLSAPLLLVTLASPAFAQTATGSSAFSSLGEPIELLPEESPNTEGGSAAFPSQFPSPLPSARASNSGVDRFNRTDVVDFYHCEYVPSEGYLERMNWVGDTSTCSAGSVSQDFHDDTRRRVNYYRAMTGLNSDITFSATKNAKSQEAALIMSRNCGLSHTPLADLPGSGWQCVSSDGDEAAGAGNISLASGTNNTGPDAVNGQIRDAGANNLAVGHRRWLLYPRAVEMGNGGIPWASSSQCSAGSVWVIGDFGTRPAAPEFVSWPNEGFVPYDLAFDRWSFSLFGANFNSATVSMMHDGQNVPVSIIHPTLASPAAGFGDPAIAWEPTGIPSTPPTSDQTYTVTISGITGVASSTYTYDVTLVDPADAGLPLDLSGNLTPSVGLAHTYTFPASAATGGYTLRARSVDTAVWKEGAETTDPNLLVDGTDASYPLVTSAVTAQTGTQSFHLAFPSFSDQSFEIDRAVLPTNTSDLTFHYIRRFSGASNTISAEISTNDGASWAELWTENGVCSGSCSSSAWDSSWQPVTISLTEWADTPTRIRFIYRPIGSTFIGTSATSHGVTIDEVSVSNSGSLSGETLTVVAAGETEVAWTPAVEQTYLLDLQAHLSCLDSSHGAALSVTAVPEPGLWMGLFAGLVAIAGHTARRGSRGAAHWGA